LEFLLDAVQERHPLPKRKRILSEIAKSKTSILQQPALAVLILEAGVP
jgi:hypothetical protein